MGREHATPTRAAVLRVHAAGSRRGRNAIDVRVVKGHLRLFLHVGPHQLGGRHSRPGGVNDGPGSCASGSAAAGIRLPLGSTGLGRGRATIRAPCRRDTRLRGRSAWRPPSTQRTPRRAHAPAEIAPRDDAAVLVRAPHRVGGDRPHVGVLVEHVECLVADARPRDRQAGPRSDARLRRLPAPVTAGTGPRPGRIRAEEIDARPARWEGRVSGRRHWRREASRRERSGPTCSNATQRSP
jgi:hypothetical protein